MEDYKKFIGYLSNITGLKAELLEKDLLLHLIMLKLSEYNFLNDYLFKGGSCLIKCYLDYYRFSVDVDFTYKYQKHFSGKSQKQIRKFLSLEINKLTKIIEKISKELSLEFKAEKTNRRYIDFSSSNKMVTFKMRYNSILDTEEFIKIQINFVEKILFKSKECKTKTLCPKNKRLEFLFPSIYRSYSQDLLIECYDVEEILCEKIRAILTRKGLKERDFIDIYFIDKNFNISIKNLEKQIIGKIKFILDLYERYRKNLIEQFKNIKDMKIREEEYLLIMPLDEDFDEFLEKLKQFLYQIMENIIKEKQ